MESKAKKVKLGDVQGCAITQQEIEAAERFEKNLSAELKKIRGKNGFSNEQMVDLLFPYVSIPNKISLLVKGKNLNVKILAATRILFNVSIDAILDKACPPRATYDQPNQGTFVEENNDEEYPRNTKKQPSLGEYALTQPEIDAIEGFRGKLDDEFIRIKRDCHFFNSAMTGLYGSCIESNRVPKMGNERHCNFKILAATRILFNVSIDKILDEACPPRITYTQPNPDKKK